MWKSAGDMADWVCSRCGTVGAQPLADVTQIDSRYTVGYCDICTVAEPAQPRKKPRLTMELVRADVWDGSAFVERTEKAQLGKLLHKFAAGHDKVNMTDREVWLLIHLWDKWGNPGFTPSQSLRVIAAAYEAANQPKGKPRRARGA